MEVLERLASGDCPEKFGFRHSSAFDPASPWSLILALYPESCAVNALKFDVSDQTLDLDNAAAEFVQAECQRLGWISANLGKDTEESFFLKTRLRQTDSACRQLTIPSKLNGVDESWLNGIVRVLQLWRRLNDGSNEPALQEFESWSAETVFEKLIHFKPLGWGLRQRLEFLVLPYLRYKDRIDLVQSWANNSLDLENVIEGVFAPELAGPLLRLCLESTLENWKPILHTIDNIRPVPDSRNEPLTMGSLDTPTAPVLEFFKGLVEVARLGKVPATRFKQLAEWSLGDVNVQQDVLIRFLQSNNHFSSQDIATLRRTVLSKLDENMIAQDTVKAALSNSRFMYIKTHPLKTHPEIVKQEIMSLVAKFDQRSPEVSLSQVITGLELIGDEDELLAKYNKLKHMQSSFGIDPLYAATHDPLDNVSKALELDTEAYLRYTDLVQIVGGKENSAVIAEMCVEAALADDNFDAVAEFIDRKFVRVESPTAWTAYYQAGKYISPSWDLPRSFAILKRQLDFLSIALSICPAGDMLAVLRTWSETDTEMAEVKLRREMEKSRESSPMTRESLMPARSDTETHRVSSEGARDHISNLLVSGIGWAIGANK